MEKSNISKKPFDISRSVFYFILMLIDIFFTIISIMPHDVLHFICCFLILIILNLIIIFIFEKRNWRTDTKTRFIPFLFFAILLGLPFLFNLIYNVNAEFQYKLEEKTREKNELHNDRIHEFISIGDVNGCVEYVNSIRSQFSEEYCESRIEQFKEDEAIKLKNISFCKTDSCLYDYALMWLDSDACLMINISAMTSYYARPIPLREQCIMEVVDRGGNASDCMLITNFQHFGQECLRMHADTWELCNQILNQTNKEFCFSRIAQNI